MNMKSLYITSLICICSLLNLNSQEVPRLAVGLNVSNNIVNFIYENYEYNGGFCIEPIVTYKLSEVLNFKSVFGYSRISSKHNYNEFQDLNYINEGAYIKAGLYINFRRSSETFNNCVGIQLFYSHFTDKGNYRIKGDYFGDYTGNFLVRNQKALFLEPSFNFFLLRKKHISIMIDLGIPIGIYGSINSGYPNYFIPGFGNVSQSQDYAVLNSYLTLSHINFYVVFPLGNK